MNPYDDDTPDMGPSPTAPGLEERGCQFRPALSRKSERREAL
jgi:hypothetical protein